ncbi:hypothetical protein B0I32_104114 [Nonomuraea fuscirosea]|uniref:SMP-30/gluconolaconase/LRE-like protein n=1 Tax=Nonomuraea fuscirosea TaxID=1291556 RepID=A0A2T0N4V0_9ACTN|nr:hypothetical protein [Nonomuraea fuscirosea]PRX67358.1 hypothetical protein B0I32_104114 [Nonomuraea fuscirosea]
MSVEVTRIDLPCPVRAAASDGTTVWCAVAGGVRAYTAAGSPLGEGGPGPELRSLAAVPGTVTGPAGVPGMLAETVIMPRSFAGASLSGPLPEGTLAGTSRDRLHWLGPSGAPDGDLPFDGRVVAGGGEIWAVGADLARRLTGPGRLGEPVQLPALDACAAEGERLWWTSRRDTILRGGPKEVELGRDRRGAMVVCAGSLWISVTGGLLRVSAWSGEPGRLVAAPEGPVPFLVCANGVLTGGARDLFTLAPAAGAPLRVIELGLDVPLALVIAAGRHVWAFPAGRPQALIVVT